MGGLNKRQKRAREQQKDSKYNRFQKVARIEEDVINVTEENSNDFEVLAELQSVEITPTSPIPIKYNKELEAGSRGKYWGNSRTVKYYREKQANEKKKGSMEITAFFSPVPALSSVNNQQHQLTSFEEEVLEDFSYSMTIKEAYDKLTPIVSPIMNAKENGERAMHDYELRKHIGVHAYFKEIIGGKGAVEASQVAATTAWIIPSEHYRARAIRSYAKEYLRFGKISPHQQGKHIKRLSLLSDEDVKTSAIQWLKNIKPEKRSMPELLKYINDIVVPDRCALPGHISSSVLHNYLKEWGYTYRANKGIYFDGHERDDVVRYRQKWAAKMVEYSHFMETYDEDDVSKVSQPNLLEGQKKIVMVTHDESTFYSNDCKTNLWLSDGENPIRKKTPGGSIMVSEFQCPCHGTMRIQGWKSRTFFHAGTNRDGYWTSKDMVKQLKDDAIPLFEKLHPGCQALFLFDQSSNHNAYAPSAKIASRFGLKDKILKSVDERVILPGKYIGSDGEQHIQNFYTLEVNKRQTKKGLKEERIWKLKGLKTILEERCLGRWEEFEAKKKHWKTNCGEQANSDHTCCPYHMLAAQPDFVAQKTALHEAVNKAGHLFALYPKYHCETNWIERYWGSAKRIARKECSYTYKALSDNLNGFLDQVSPPNSPPLEIRHYYNRCWRYINAYNDMNNVTEAFKLVEKFTSRRYRSHRRIGKND